jgi:hypothetical protein
MLKPVLISDISFPNSRKVEVSGIELQNGLSAIFFGAHGEQFRLVRVSFLFPYPLRRGETADVGIKYIRDKTFKNITFKLFSARMVGRESKKDVLRGTFLVVPA